MKKNILIATLLTLVAFSATAKEGHLNPYWFGESVDKSTGNDNLNSISNFMDGVVDSTVGAFYEYEDQSVNKATKNGWHFAGFQTGIALGLSGSIGIISYGGTTAIELDWAKRANAKKEKLESSTPTVTINENSTKADLNKSLDPLVKNLVATGRITDENEFRKNLASASDDFYAYTKGLSTSRTRYVWRAGKIRLDLTFAASGKINTSSGIKIKLGADVRVRLEFVRIMEKPLKADKAIESNPDLDQRGKKIAKKTRDLLDNLSYETTKSYDELEKKYPIEDNNFEFNAIQIGIGVSIEASVSVVKLKGGISPSVFFYKHVVSSSTPLPTDKAAGEGTISVVIDDDDKGIRDTRFKFKKRRIRKGLKRAMKFAHRFSKMTHKKSVKRQERIAKGRKIKTRKWYVKKIKTQFKFETGGKLGPVKLKTAPHLSLYWVNKNS